MFLAWYAISATRLSARINDVSQGQDATPLWIPQTLMAVGAVIFAVALVDTLLRIVTSGHPGIDPPDAGVDLRSLVLQSRTARVLAAGAALLVIYAATQAMTGFDRDAVALKIGIFLFVMFFLLGSGIWVGLALMGVAYIGMIGFTSRNPGNAMIITVWTSASSWTLTALPLFIWMGEILYRTRLSEDMFRGLAPWLSRIPGGLLHTNVVGCTVFAAVSGSSAATLTTVGKMSIPELQKRGYPEFMTIGTLAGAATLGLMIPPSLTLIVYGVTVKESITRLFMAGVVPGLVLAAMFMAYIVAWYYLRPGQRPEPDAPIGLRRRPEELHAADSGHRPRGRGHRLDVYRIRHADRSRRLRRRRRAGAGRGPGLALPGDLHGQPASGRPAPAR